MIRCPGPAPMISLSSEDVARCAAPELSHCDQRLAREGLERYYGCLRQIEQQLRRAYHAGNKAKLHEFMRLRNEFVDRYANSATGKLEGAKKLEVVIGELLRRFRAR